jgi:putative hydrolase of the HAD superfamily
MRSFRAVFFDLDGTLLDEGEPYRQAVRETCLALTARHPGVETSLLEAAFLRISEAVWRGGDNVTRGYVSGAIAGIAIRTRMWGEALAAIGAPAVLAEEAASVYAEQRRRNYRLFDDAAPVLQALRERWTVGVVTNGSPEVQREKTLLSGLDPFVEFVVVSGEVGAGKPDPRPFLRALELAGVEPRDVLFVGDSLVNDVGGSQAVGMTAAWVNRARDALPLDAPLPDIELPHLAGLLGHLGLPLLEKRA